MKRNRLTGSIIILLAILGLIPLKSCLSDDNMTKAEKRMIELYLESLGDTIYEQKASGLIVIPLVEGTGDYPAEKDTVVFRGRGMYLDYIVFSSSLNTAYPETYVIGSGEKIPGIDEGLKYMKVGGKTRLLTPSYLAYNVTPLLWEINLLAIKPGPGK